MVGEHTVAVGTEHLETAPAQPLEGLRSGHLMAVMAVDIELLRTVGNGGYHMGIPHLIKKESFPSFQWGIC